MSKCHVYIDGSWLYKQCSGKGVLGKRTVYGKIFLDYRKLIELIVNEVGKATGESVSAGEELHYFTSVIKDIPASSNIKIEGEDYSLEQIRSRSKTALETMTKVVQGGVTVTNFEIGFRPWMAKAIAEGSYQEKMVDTAIVAKFVINSLKEEYSSDYHAILSGDLDMLAAFEEVLMEVDPSLKILLVTIDPVQWDQKDSQVSKDLAQFEHFAIPSILLDRFIPEIMQGDNVLQCQGCSKYFDAKTSKLRLCKHCDPIHKDKNPQRDMHTKRITRTIRGKNVK